MSKFSLTGVPLAVYRVVGSAGNKAASDVLVAELEVPSYAPGVRHNARFIGGVADELLAIPEDFFPCVVELGKVGGGWRLYWRGRMESGWSDSVPKSVEELSDSAQLMLRDSLGIPDGEPVPIPAGELPTAERPAEPYRFDPSPHLDLSKAEVAPPLPPPVPIGPQPSADAQTFIVPSFPVPRANFTLEKIHGQPFAH